MSDTPSSNSCPKCSAEYAPGALECSACGIIFAKWQARQEPVVDEVENTKKFPVLILLLVVVVGIAVAAGWLLYDPEPEIPPLAANQVRVTYTTGEQCLWNDWSFKIRREVQNNRARGNVLITGRPNVETEIDTTLRVYTENGEKLALTRDQLREFSFTTVPDVNNSSNNTVVSLTIKTANNSIRFPAIELPKFSRSRVLVPVASYYFPQQSGDYMRWGNVRMTLAGKAAEGCSIDREISLTRPGHYKKRTPERVEFPGL